MPAPGEARRDRLARARLYLVTGARQREGDLPGFLEAVLAAGADIVQLREKDAEARDLLRWSVEFRGAADRHGALFILNDRPDVALAAGADGVHLGQDDLPPAWARGIVGPDLLIGLSTHATGEYDASAPEADYLCTGPIHETPTKPGRPATGLGLVRHAAAREREGSEPRPWFAIGGVDPATLPDVIEAGASRIAIVRAVTDAQDPADAVRRLRAEMQGFPVS